MPHRCSSCSADLPPGAKFCGQCGAPQIARCPACGAPVAQPDQRFCLECGTALRAPAGPETAGPDPATGSLEGPGASSGSAVFGLPAVERRLVSVLFADLTGFTTFSESRDAEDVRGMLSDYFATSRRIVTSYGGTVEKFIGDAVMAVWGAPVAREDDAERAVRAALDLVAAITGLGDRLELELRLRVGVLTGEAAVELSHVGEGMVIGDAVNTASRLQTLAAPGSVLVDDVTRLASERAIVYEDAGAHMVKGKSRPVQAWKPLRVVAAVGGVGRTLVELPLVGRGAELDVLRGTLEGLMEPGAQLQLLSVVGEAGLGKSRLAWELEKYADGLAATVLWHRGQASSFGEGVGFWALADMVRMRAEITVEDPQDVERAKLDALVHGVFAGELIGARIGRALARLLGVDDGLELIDHGELFSSWRLLFERLADRDPVVLLFEDLHWADQGLFDFIGHLTEWAARSPILVLVFSRPDGRLDALTERGQRIDLAPLAPREIEALIDQAVSDAPAELVSSVRDHAGGVPLFAVESLRMLADRGVMVAEGDADRYRLVGDLRDLEVPPSIHALIAARLDGLGADERHVLLDAAVLGQRFSGAASAALAGVTVPQVRGLLDGLVAKQFLTVTTDPRSPERGQYAFAHRQTQRVALATMSKHARKARHLGAAEWLAQGDADPDLAGVFAGHLLAAADADPAASDAEAIRRRALATVLEAARRAANLGALLEAATLFERAAKIEPDESRRTEHYVEAARCAERYGSHEAAAAEHYAAARELHEAAGRSREALSLRARELYVYRWTRPAAQLIKPLRAVYESLQELHDGAFAAAAAALAGVLYSDGNAGAAEVIASEAASAAGAADAHEELGLALNCRASALIELGRPAQALDLFRAALRLRERHAPGDVASTLANIAITLSALGRFEEAADAATTAIAAAERVASRADRELATLHLARILFCLGRWDEALDTVGLVALETTPANDGMTIGAPVLISLARGTPDVARSVIEQFDGRQAVSGAAFESDYRSLRAVALAHLDHDPDRAMAAVAEAGSGDYAEWPTWLPLAVDLIIESSEDALQTTLAALRGPVAPKTSPHVRAQIERLTAYLASRRGDLDAAAAHWQTAVQIMSEAGVVFDAAVLALELAERARDDRGAAIGRAEAIATFARLGAEPWLQRARHPLTERRPG